MKNVLISFVIAWLFVNAGITNANSVVIGNATYEGATAYDSSGRSQTYMIVQVIKDTIAPGNISLDSLIENSEFLYYDEPTETLYYSSDQIMSDSFIITILAEDNVDGAGLFNLTGSSAFNEIPTDTSYDSVYVINYTVDCNETGDEEAEVGIGIGIALGPLRALAFSFPRPLSSSPCPDVG